MRKVVLFILATGMIAGGAWFIFVQLFFSPVIYFKILLGSTMLVVIGIFLMWEDFIEPFFARLALVRKNTSDASDSG